MKIVMQNPPKVAFQIAHRVFGKDLTGETKDSLELRDNVTKRKIRKYKEELAKVEGKKPTEYDFNRQRRSHLKLRKQVRRAALLNCNTKRLNRYNPANGKLETILIEKEIANEKETKEKGEN